MYAGEQLEIFNCIYDVMIWNLLQDEAIDCCL